VRRSKEDISIPTGSNETKRRTTDVDVRFFEDMILMRLKDEAKGSVD